MLHLCQTLRTLYDLPQALIVELVGGSSRCSPTKSGPYRHDVVLFRDILMNDVIGKASQRELSAREEDLNLIRIRKFADAIEDVGGLFVT
jgi:hypothetical protein